MGARVPRTVLAVDIVVVGERHNIYKKVMESVSNCWLIVAMEVGAHDSYDDAWYHADSRNLHHRDIHKFFAENHEKFNMQGMTSFLSVGPGYGHMDIALMKDFLPNLKKYFVIEACSNLLDCLKKSLSKSGQTHLKLYPVHSTLENYDGIEESVDFVFLSHILYYVRPDFGKQIEKVYEKLSPNGLMVIVIDPGDEDDHDVNFYTEVEAELGFKPDIREVNSKSIKLYLESIGLKYKEYRIPCYMNIAPGNGLKEYITVSINREPTKEQMETWLAIAEKYRLVGTDLLKTEQSVIVIEKKS